MPNEERILRTNLKSGGNRFDITPNRNSNMAYSTKLRGDISDYSPGATSQDNNDLLLRQERNRHRWLSVLKNKEDRIENRQKRMKDQLNKGFTKEKEIKNVINRVGEEKLIVFEKFAETRERVLLRKQAEKVNAVKKRKEDEKLY